MPTLAKEVEKDFREYAQWWMVNETTLKTIEMYNVEENDYAILLNARGMIFYSGRVDDIGLDAFGEQLTLLLKNKNPTQNLFQSTRLKFDRRYLSLKRPRYVEIKEFFKKEFLPRIEKFKQKYEIKEYNKYWLEYSIKITRAFQNCADKNSCSKYFSVDVHLRTIEPIYKKLLEEYPGLLTVLNNQPGCNFLKSVQKLHTILPYDKCQKCKKTEKRANYFFCRKCKQVYCDECGWHKVTRNKSNTPPPHSHYLYYVSTKSIKFKNLVQILKEEEYFEGFEQEHTVQCNACMKKTFSGIRFRCAICQNMNVCENCFVGCLKNNTKTIDRLADIGCDFVSHVYLAIFYNNVF